MCRASLPVCVCVFLCVRPSIQTNNNLCRLQIAKLKEQLQQRRKPAASGGHGRDRQRGFPQGSCSLGATQVRAPKHAACVHMHLTAALQLSIHPSGQLFNSSKRIRKRCSSLQEVNKIKH